jgi:3-oxoacyl-[acyl-carrier-protein] synthase-3
MELRGAQITGLGSYVPERVLTNADLEKMVETTDEWITSHTGMKERRIAAPEQATSDLALAAARSALTDAGVAARDLDLVIVATVTPDTIFPCTASLVQGALKAKRAGAFDLSVGCTGFVYALATATAFVQSGAMDRVLVVGADTLSRITNWEDRSTCVLFGDGAGAVVVTAAEPGVGIRGFELWSDGTKNRHLRLTAGGSRRPIDEQALREKAHLIAMDGHDVFKLAVRGCPDVAEAVMKKTGLTHEDIDWAIFHQANRRIIEAAARRLDIPDERVVCDVEKYANTSAATIPLAMDELYKEGKLKTGDMLLLAGFGAGFSLAGGIVEWTK